MATGRRYDAEPKLNISKVIAVVIALVVVLMLITFITHFQIAKTDPGIINYNNNIDMLEFYYFLYYEIIELKEEYNLKYKQNK